ncbi:hypothetical protein [Streptomyces sp. CAI-155]|uniref:hypothetical protein n=1 Tax=Streptomyces TaxID=1883 RepID=UPI0015877341|nr:MULTISPECIES: hypothetical protein [Streptomyces]NUV83117.1 hypothetical protein [Streptomyces sp. CAI-155]
MQLAQMFHQAERAGRGVRQPQRGGQLAQQPVFVADVTDIDKAPAVPKILGYLMENHRGQSALSDADRSGDGEYADLGVRNPIPDLGRFGLATHQARSFLSG